MACYVEIVKWVRILQVVDGQHRRQGKHDRTIPSFNLHTAGQHRPPGKHDRTIPPFNSHYCMLLMVNIARQGEARSNYPAIQFTLLHVVDGQHRPPGGSTIELSRHSIHTTACCWWSTSPARGKHDRTIPPFNSHYCMLLMVNISPPGGSTIELSRIIQFTLLHVVDGQHRPPGEARSRHSIHTTACCWWSTSSARGKHDRTIPQFNSHYCMVVDGQHRPPEGSTIELSRHSIHTTACCWWSTSFARGKHDRTIPPFNSHYCMLLMVNIARQIGKHDRTIPPFNSRYCMLLMVNIARQGEARSNYPAIQSTLLRVVDGQHHPPGEARSNYSAIQFTLLHAVDGQHRPPGGSTIELFRNSIHTTACCWWSTSPARGKHDRTIPPFNPHYCMLLMVNITRQGEARSNYPAIQFTLLHVVDGQHRPPGEARSNYPAIQSTLLRVVDGQHRVRQGEARSNYPAIQFTLLHVVDGQHRPPGGSTIELSRYSIHTTACCWWSTSSARGSTIELSRHSIHTTACCWWSTSPARGKHDRTIPPFNSRYFMLLMVNIARQGEARSNYPAIQSTLLRVVDGQHHPPGGSTIELFRNSIHTNYCMLLMVNIARQGEARSNYPAIQSTLLRVVDGQHHPPGEARSNYPAIQFTLLHVVDGQHRPPGGSTIELSRHSIHTTACCWWSTSPARGKHDRTIPQFNSLYCMLLMVNIARQGKHDRTIPPFNPHYCVLLMVNIARQGKHDRTIPPFNPHYCVLLMVNPHPPGGSTIELSRHSIHTTACCWWSTSPARGKHDRTIPSFNIHYCMQARINNSVKSERLKATLIRFLVQHRVSMRAPLSPSPSGIYGNSLFAPSLSSPLSRILSPSLPPSISSRITIPRRVRNEFVRLMPINGFFIPRHRWFRGRTLREPDRDCSAACFLATGQAEHGDWRPATVTEKEGHGLSVPQFSVAVVIIRSSTNFQTLAQYIDRAKQPPPRPPQQPPLLTQRRRAPEMRLILT